MDEWEEIDDLDFEQILMRFRKHRKRRYKFIDHGVYNVHDDIGVQDREYYVNKCSYGVDSHKGKQHSSQYNIKKR